MKFGNWILAPSKYLDKESATSLLNAAKQCAERSRRKLAVRDYFVIHLALATGLRVMEIAALKCGDLHLEDKVASVWIRKGKGRKQRRVFFNDELREHCQQYLSWQKNRGRPIWPEEPLFPSSNTGQHMTTRAIQKIFKRCAAKAGLPQSYSIHCLRHTYACFLLKASDWNLRLVQKQLGHSKITTTQVYADVMMPDIEKALSRLD